MLMNSTSFSIVIISRQTEWRPSLSPILCWTANRPRTWTLWTCNHWS